MRNKGVWLLGVLVVLLVAVLIVGELVIPVPQHNSDEDGQVLLDAMFDRIGVTRWGEALDWYEMEEGGLLDYGIAQSGTPVWVARGGSGNFHSNPLCSSGIKAPVRMTLGEAEAEGRVPCNVCWDMG